MISKIKKLASSTSKEIAAINWPSRQRTYNDTLVVVVGLVIGGVAIALLDGGLNSLVTLAISKIGS